MIETDLINVPLSGTGEVPLISIGGAHKGVTYMRLDYIYKEMFYYNDNVDCIQTVFDNIPNEYFEDAIKRGIDLKKAVYDVMKIVWSNESEYSFSKCFHCYNGETPNGNCTNTGWEAIEYDPQMFPLNIMNHNIANYCTFPSLKELDLRKNGKVSLTAKIKNIQNPELSNGQYTQKIIVYDDNTNKTIKATFDDKYADFDKWQKGDTIRLIGAINNDFKRPLGIDYVIKIEREEEIIEINRNQETPGYNDWRQTILNRDKKCVCCGHDKHLEAHHLFGYKENPALAVNEHNGVTLCKFCHDKYHNIYGVKDINPVDFVNFVRKFGVR